MLHSDLPRLVAVWSLLVSVTEAITPLLPGRSLQCASTPSVLGDSTPLCYLLFTGENHEWRRL